MWLLVLPDRAILMADQEQLVPPPAGAAPQPAAAAPLNVKTLVNGAQRVTQFFPFTTFTMFQTLIAIITTSGRCDDDRAKYIAVWVTFAILCAATFVLAVTSRYVSSNSALAALGDTKVESPHASVN